MDEGLLKENPIIEPVAAISAGILDNQILLDLEYSEDSIADVDANIVMTASGKIVEFQTTAEGNPFSEQQLIELLHTGKKAIFDIIEMQKQALAD